MNIGMVFVIAAGWSDDLAWHGEDVEKSDLRDRRSSVAYFARSRALGFFSGWRWLMMVMRRPSVVERVSLDGARGSPATGSQWPNILIYPHTESSDAIVVSTRCCCCSFAHFAAVRFASFRFARLLYIYTSQVNSIGSTRRFVAAPYIRPLLRTHFSSRLASKCARRSDELRFTIFLTVKRKKRQQGLFPYDRFVYFQRTWNFTVKSIDVRTRKSDRPIFLLFQCQGELYYFLIPLNNLMMHNVDYFIWIYLRTWEIWKSCSGERSANRISWRGTILNW